MVGEEATKWKTMQPKNSNTTYCTCYQIYAVVVGRLFSFSNVVIVQYVKIRSNDEDFNYIFFKKNSATVMGLRET